MNELSDDELFLEAVKVVVEKQEANSSLLQRRLRIGYGKAIRLMEKLQEADIITAPQRVVVCKVIPKNMLIAESMLAVHKSMKKR